MTATSWESMTAQVAVVKGLWPKALLRYFGGFSKSEVDDTGSRAYQSDFYTKSGMFPRSADSLEQELLSGGARFFTPDPDTLTAVAADIDKAKHKYGELAAKINYAGQIAVAWDGHLALALTEHYFPHLTGVALVQATAQEVLRDTMEHAAGIYEDARKSVYELAKQMATSLQKVIDTGKAGGLTVALKDIGKGLGLAEKAINLGQQVPVVGDKLQKAADAVGTAQTMVGIAEKGSNLVFGTQKETSPFEVVESMRKAFTDLAKQVSDDEQVVIGALKKAYDALDGHPKEAVAAPVEWAGMPTKDLMDSFRPGGTTPPSHVPDWPEPDPETNYGSV